jgi:hypothetical protein
METLILATTGRFFLNIEDQGFALHLSKSAFARKPIYVRTLDK